MNKILRFAEVRERTGLSRATVYRRVRLGTFPAPLDLADTPKNHQLGWIEGEISDWVAARPRHIPKGHGRAKPKEGAQSEAMP